MDALLTQLTKHIIVAKLQIREFSGVVFLCGGQIDESNAVPISARDCFLRRIKETKPELYVRIFLAEAITGWFNDMIRESYTPDLLSFETHVSGIASAVCLIVESPGSIAELGAFCVLEGIRERLMVAVRQEWNTEGSFISLGPISYIKEKAPSQSNPVYVYPWRMHWDENLEKSIPNLDDLNDHADNFIEDLQHFESGLPKTPKFDPGSQGHVSLLIADLIELFSALRITELEKILQSLSIDKFDRKTIKGHLLLLEKFGFIKKSSYRQSDYFVSVSSRSFIEYNLEDAPSDVSDRPRFKVIVSEHYRKNDRSRLLAIKAARRTPDDGGNGDVD